MKTRAYVMSATVLVLLTLLVGVATAQGPAPDNISQLTLPFEGVVNTTGTGFAVLNTGAGQSAVGVAGRSDNGYAGLVGYSASRHGAFGLSVSATDAGVYGRNDGAGIGVWARADNGTALQATSVNGQAITARSVNRKAIFATTAVNGDSAIFAENTGPSGFGLIATTLNGHAIRGEAQNGQGVVAIGRNSDGIDAQTSAENRAAVYAHHEGALQGSGVTATTNNGIGAYGFSGDGPGVRGVGTRGPGVDGYSNSNGQSGVYGQMDSSNGHGVRGRADNSSSIGVYGVSRDGRGVYGESSNNDGVTGYSAARDRSAVVARFGADSFGNALYAEGNRGLALFGRSNREDGIDVGTTGSGKSAIYAHYDGTGSGNAGFFVGRVEIVGTIQKSGGTFQIDHPLDPANKTLRHSFVESPDMMNVYNGNVVTDAKGEAVVTLPDYFEALNRDFRYQLTPIGQFAQAIVAEEVSHNKFVIKTDKPNVKVSWQVTGIRKDAWAEANRVVVEEDKVAAEKGYYYNPEVFGQPSTRGIYYGRNAESMQARDAMAQKYQQEQAEKQTLESQP